MTVTFQCDHPNDLTAFCRRHLEKEGYKVETAGEWEAVGKFCRRIGITDKAFIKIRTRRGCPDFETDEGPTGRMIRIKVTPKLERFCRMHKQQPK